MTMQYAMRKLQTAARNCYTRWPRIRQPVSVGVRLWLVLSLWHAPIPWFHSHEISDSAEHAGFLSRHVHEFHADEMAQGEAHPGWHWHLILPWCFDGHLTCPTE